MTGYNYHSPISKLPQSFANEIAEQNNSKRERQKTRFSHNYQDWDQRIEKETFNHYVSYFWSFSFIMFKL